MHPGVLDPRDRLELPLGGVGVGAEHGRALEVVDDGGERAPRRCTPRPRPRRRRWRTATSRARPGGDHDEHHATADERPTAAACGPRPAGRRCAARASAARSAARPSRPRASSSSPVLAIVDEDRARRAPSASGRRSATARRVVVDDDRRRRAHRRIGVQPRTPHPRRSASTSRLSLRCQRRVRASSFLDRRGSSQVDLLAGGVGIVGDRRRTPAAARRATSADGVSGSACRPSRSSAASSLEADEADLAAQPVRRSPRRPARRTASITARTSAAEPPSAAWMKLACFSETQAVPMRSPRSPSPSMSSAGADLAGHRVDEHRAAVLPARLVLAPPADDLGDLRLGRLAGRPARRRSRPPSTTSCGPEVRAAEAQAEVAAGRAHDAGSSASRSTTSTSTSAGRDVRAVAAGVHAHRPADRAGHADRPLEPGEPRRRRARASTGSAHPAAGRRPRAVPSTSIARRASSAMLTAMPGEAGVGDEQVRATPDDEHRAGPTRARGRGDGQAGRRPCGRARTARPGPRPGRWSAAPAARRASASGPSTRERRGRRRRQPGAHDAPSGRPGGRAPPRAAWRCRRSPSRCTRRPGRPRRRGTTPGPRAAAATRPAPAGGRRARR